MKKIQLICVGRVKERFFSDAVAEYAKRMNKYCEFSLKELPDFADGADGLKKESLSILGEMDGYSVLTDIGGEMLTSEELAAALDKAFLSAPKVQFIIGGSHGVSDEVRRKAALRLSFGRMTFPHQLMRVITAEQIYRALTISAGTAYHK